MVDFIDLKSDDFILNIKTRCPSKLINYIVNNTSNKFLYFFYGNDMKYYKIAPPEIYNIRKFEVDATGQLPLIEILSSLVKLLGEGIRIILYTNDDTYIVPSGIIKLPTFVLPKIKTSY